MKEYIEREGVRHKIRTWIKRAEEKEEYAAAECFEDCLYLLNDTPAADIVEVVRCKDCVCGYKTQNGQIICKFLEAGNFIPYVKPNDYCSYGEKKEE